MSRLEGSSLLFFSEVTIVIVSVFIMVRKKNRGRKRNKKENKADAASSSSVAHSSVMPQPSDVAQSMGQLLINSSLLAFAHRPKHFGTRGTEIMVLTNHFRADFSDRFIFKYKVSISPSGYDWKVMNQFLGQELNVQQFSAYDGGKHLYTAVELDTGSKHLWVLINPLDQTGKRNVKFTVDIELAEQHELCQLGEISSGSQTDNFKIALQALAIILRAHRSQRCLVIGKSFYPHIKFPMLEPLGDGLEIRVGFNESIRPTLMGPTVNIDSCFTPFFKSQSVTNFVTELLHKNRLPCKLSDGDILKISKALDGVHIEVQLQQYIRQYRVSGLSVQTTKELKSGGQMKHIPDTIRIEHPEWPCLKVTAGVKTIYFPMEVSCISQDQVFKHMLNDELKTNWVDRTSQDPSYRASVILQIVKDNAYDYANVFGVKINENLVEVGARILPSPKLKFGDAGAERVFDIDDGCWNMTDKKLLHGGAVRHWICICFERNLELDDAIWFCHKLGSTCRGFGMDFDPQPVFAPVKASPDDVEMVLKDCVSEALAKIGLSQKLDLTIVFLPNKNGSLYGRIKRICETDIGIVSQCISYNTVLKEEDQQVLSSLALKVNAKVGGKNAALVDAPFLKNKMTMIFGADVSHNADNSIPSIAAVVASQDLEMTTYAALICSQANGQEFIYYGGMIREHIERFREKYGELPASIIFYRDGVGEDQFRQVLEIELNEIYKACAYLEDKYKPDVTFMVVIKRHKTRFFHSNPAMKGAPSKGAVVQVENVFPGTVVDSHICHPTFYDFYLCSHGVVKGTSRPTRYCVLFDDNNFTADDLQCLTHQLCYTCVRCTNSISIVPAAYYAHLAAYRGRYYMRPEKSEAGAAVAGSGRGGFDGVGSSTSATGADCSVSPLADLQEKVKSLMFYC